MPQRTVQSDSRKTFCVAVSAVALSATVAAVWFHDSHGSQLATLPELIAEAHRLETVLQHDSSHGTALLFSVIDPATVTDPLKTEVQDLASQAIENLKRYTEAPFLDTMQEQREAIRRLRRFKFTIDPKITPADARAIVDCFAKYHFWPPGSRRCHFVIGTQLLS